LLYQRSLQNPRNYQAEGLNDPILAMMQAFAPNEQGQQGDCWTPIEADDIACRRQGFFGGIPQPLSAGRWLTENWRQDDLRVQFETMAGFLIEDFRHCRKLMLSRRQIYQSRYKRCGWRQIPT
jgi:hypothetical protein